MIYFIVTGGESDREHSASDIEYNAEEVSDAPETGPVDTKTKEEIHLTFLLTRPKMTYQKLICRRLSFP